MKTNKDIINEQFEGLVKNWGDSAELLSFNQILKLMELAQQEIKPPQHKPSVFICKHEKLSKSGESARCECGKYLGWWCPSSPDNECHYYSQEKDGKFVLTLRNGQEHVIADYSKNMHDNEEEDWCIFCGQPEERK